jgi:hypothetical protein
MMVDASTITMRVIAELINPLGVGIVDGVEHRLPILE